MPPAPAPAPPPPGNNSFISHCQGVEVQVQVAWCKFVFGIQNGKNCGVKSFYSDVALTPHDGTLASRIDVGPTFINFGFFSRPYGLIRWLFAT
jgi:hypothetical protein